MLEENGVDAAGGQTESEEKDTVGKDLPKVFNNKCTWAHCHDISHVVINLCVLIKG